jgi:hypothetical protein
MTPAESQQRALDALEKLGSKPVVLREDAQLSNHARIHVAAENEPAHVLTYNPAATPELPYLVCFQCSLAERALRSARDERFNVASTSETYSQVQKLVRAKQTIPEDMVATYSRMITDGLGVQLRSMPIGIRVDRVLYNAHPELRDMQRVIAERQLKESVGCLSPAIKEMAPELIFNASVGMNAALALAWSRLWNEDAHVVPYRLAGYVGLGERLLAALDAIPDTPHHDRELVSSWAEILGVDRLYQIGPVGL